jgi:hypothetical protein
MKGSLDIPHPTLASTSHFLRQKSSMGWWLIGGSPHFKHVQFGMQDNLNERFWKILDHQMLKCLNLPCQGLAVASKYGIKWKRHGEGPGSYTSEKEWLNVANSICLPLHPPKKNIINVSIYVSRIHWLIHSMYKYLSIHLLFMHLFLQYMFI